MEIDREDIYVCVCVCVCVCYSCWVCLYPFRRGFEASVVVVNTVFDTRTHTHS